MKLQIVSNETPIGGFTPLTVKQVFEDMSHIHPNECSEIIIGDHIKEVPFKYVERFFINLIRKLRLNGNIKISGVDARQLSLGLTNATVSMETYNQVVQDSTSVVSCDYVIGLLRKYNLKIETYNIKGLMYEISASRKD